MKTCFHLHASHAYHALSLACKTCVSNTTTRLPFSSPKPTDLNTCTFAWLGLENRIQVQAHLYLEESMGLWGTLHTPTMPSSHLRQDPRAGAGVANSTGFIDPGIYNTAKMTGLAPGTRYYYIYGDEVIILEHVRSGTIDLRA